MIELTIDGHPIRVPKGTTVYQAAKQLNIDLPIFCYQDRMPPFGACRVCLVEVENNPRLQTSCTLEATEGMVVHTRSTAAVDGRERILEFLLINHPLDCPICDRGGECPLQDQTMAHGPGKSRFYEEKRHFKKPLPLGPVLMLDRERCILCARCTRFGEILAGDHALQIFDRGYRSEVGTPDAGTPKSKFIGNTIEICPVGALTSRVYRFRARPWDNARTETTCTLCPVGCRMILDSRDGEIMRTRSLENREVNDIWLCDKGWFGYEFSHHPGRLTHPLLRRNGTLTPASWEEVLSLVAEKIKEGQPSGRMAAWSGSALTVEDYFLIQKLFRQEMGIPHIDSRIGSPLFSLEEEGLPPGMEIAIHECEELSSVFLFGLQLTEEFPVIWLRLKQAINRGAHVFFFGHQSPEIAPYMKEILLHAPGEELSILREHLPRLAGLGENGKKGALFVGREYLATPERRLILSELLKWKEQHPSFSLNVLEGRGNQLGARFAGMRPDLAPGGLPVDQPGMNAQQVLKQAAEKGWEVLYVIGANPAGKFPSSLWQEARKNLRFMVVQDLFLTETAKQADVVLPTLCFVEKGGHFMNIERRLQKLQPGKHIPETMYNDIEILTELAGRLGISLTFDPSFLDCLKTGERLPPFWSGKPELRGSSSATLSSSSPGSNHSGLKASFAHLLFDHGVRMQHNPQLVQLAPKPVVRLHSSEAIKRGIKNGENVRLKSSQSPSPLTAQAVWDDGVARNTLILPIGFKDIPVHELGLNLLNGEEIQIGSA